MRISDNTNASCGQIPGRYEVTSENDKGNILTKAIKDYKGEYLTGLTVDGTLLVTVLSPIFLTLK